MLNHVEIGSKIESRRKELELTLADVANEVGVAASTIQRYEKGHFDKIKMPVIEAIAEALQVNPDWLLGYTDDPYDYDSDPDNLFASIPSDQFDHLMNAYNNDLKQVWKARQAIEDDARNSALNDDLPPDAIPFVPSATCAPILGAIPAGYPTLAKEEIEGYAQIDYPDTHNYFWLRVRGDSMINAGIETGDLVLIRKQPCADDGQIVACRVNGDEATLKRFRQQDDAVVLVPENPKYPPKIVPASDFENGYASIIGVAVEIKRELL